MQIQVSMKNVYGHDKIYPACPKAEVFCRMLSQKTLTNRDIGLIKELGFEVQVVNSRPERL